MKFSLIVCLASLVCLSYAKDSPLNPNNCGLRISQEDSDKIVGGTEAAPKDWAWQIALEYEGSFICGGSLINNRWVVTAAHCIDTSAPPQSFMVKLGIHDRMNPEIGYEVRTADKVIVHKKYDQWNTKNDIALIRLDSPVEFSDQIVPICIPDDSIEFAANSSSWATGWGLTEEGGDDVSRYLMQVELPILSEEECQSVNGGGVSYETQICSGKPYAGQDSCQGDSGGPLVAQDSQSNKWYLAGITSWGIGCSGGGVYTRTSSYRKWILHNIGSN